MKGRKIYFPRADKAWEETNDIRVNGYLNVLRFTKSTYHETAVSIALGGEIPYLKKNQFKRTRISPEKNLAYACGLYYEEYMFDSETEFIQNVIKNLKMRIVLVILYKNDANLGTEPVPVVCCGYDYDEDAFIIIDVQDGTTKNMNVEECSLFEGQNKLLMLNVPGMVNMKELEENYVISIATKLFIRRFFSFINAQVGDFCGISLFKYCLERGLKPIEIPGFQEHAKWQLQWLSYVMEYGNRIGSKELSLIQYIQQLYQAIGNDEYKKWLEVCLNEYNTNNR
ncbi:MAG TPA: hypothetical protein DCW90_14575 [Lachnospiraceae bacterium]|nr:hypothetical protein [uncultured Lachnoclostridium sp.]HAU86659.1 hypothetical protein [Lachnospiraceae bacterium]